MASRSDDPAQPRKWRGERVGSPGKLEWALVALGTAIAGWLRLSELTALSLDGDDGFTALAVAGVLEHGIPELPGGLVYWKSLLYTYLAASLQGIGLGPEAALRLPNALASTALVPLSWWVTRRIFGPLPALATAAVLALHLWGVEMGRHARYYGVLQVMVLLFVERFHRVHVQGFGRARWGLGLVFLLALLTHTIALSLCLFYVPLFLADRFRLLRERGFLVEVLGIAAIVVAWFAFESTWEVGFVARPDEGALSAVRALLGGYSTALVAWWPVLSPRLVRVALGACLVAAIASRLAKAPVAGGRALWLLAVATVGILAGLGFGQANHQPRYLFFTFPLVAMVAFGAVDVAARGAMARRPSRGTVAAAIAVLLAAFWGSKDLLVQAGRRVPDRTHEAQLLHPQFLPSTTKRFSWDHEVPGRFVADHLEDGDRVFGMHPIFTQHYAGRLDGWIWRAERGTWDAYHERDGRPYDNYVGAPLMRTLGGLKEQLVLTPGRVWVVTTPSLAESDHVDPRIRSFLELHPDARVQNGRDGFSGAYLWADGVGMAGEEPHPFWEIERMPSATGRIVVDGEASRGAARELVEGKDRSGVVSHGPYRTFPAGEYEARFHLAGLGASVRIEAVVARVATTLAEAEIELAADSYEVHPLTFSLEEATEIELRVIWHGDDRLRADRVDLVPSVEAHGEIRVLCVGDSITELGYPPFLEPLLEEGLDRPVTVVNGGRRGNTTREYLGHLLHSDLLARADPDFVLMQLGTNDVRVDSDRTDRAEFERNLAALVRLVRLHRNGRGRAPRVVLGKIPPLHATPNPFDRHSPRRIVEEINPSIARMAVEGGMALNDPFDRLGDPARFPDGIHLDAAGNQVLAEAWAETLIAALEAAPP